MSDKQKESQVIQFPERPKTNSQETGEAVVVGLHEWRYRNHPSVVRND